MLKILMILLLTVGTLFSQGMNMPSLDEQMKQLNEVLELNETQHDTVKTLVSEFREKMKSMRDEMMSGSGDRMAMMGKFMTSLNEYKVKVKAVLDDKQKKKFDTFLEDQMQRRRTRMRN